MSKLKLMTIVGTRPEIIRLSETIKKCDRYFDHCLIHTGQNYDYELNQIFFDDLGLRQPDGYLNVAGADLGETIGNVIARSFACLSSIRPDALLVLGDTNSCLAAIAAKRLHIPIFHMEAGNRCFDERLPEESNRRIVDVTADVNLCYSEHARRNLLSEGRPRERTFVTGSPMAEVLFAHRDRIRDSDVLNRFNLEPRGYFLLSAHREENVDEGENLRTLFDAVSALCEEYNKPVLYSMHPRSKKRIEESGISLHPLVQTHSPLSFTDYNRLQMDAFCVVSDSGTLPEEAAYFSSEGRPFPAVCVRTSTERPEALEAGVFVIGSLVSESVLQAVEVAVHMTERGEQASKVCSYDGKNVSTKIINLIQSYTRLVNDLVWRKR